MEATNELIKEVLTIIKEMKIFTVAEAALISGKEEAERG